MKAKKEALIYGLLDPRDRQIHYIGTTRTGALRFEVHDKPARWVDLCLAYCEWRINLARSGERTELIALDFCPTHMQFSKEKEWIKKGQELGWPLTNCVRDSTPAERELRDQIVKTFINDELLLKIAVKTGDPTMLKHHSTLGHKFR